MGVISRLLVAGLVFVLVLTLAPLGIASAAEFSVVNSSGVTLDHFYMVECSAPHWGANQLERYPIVHSRAYTVTHLAPGCYDMMVVLPGGNECAVAGVNVHGSMAWVISRTTWVQARINACSSVSNFVSVASRPLQPANPW
jgi:hypothetical protein